MNRRNGRASGQVLVEYILLSVMVLGATVFVIRFIIFDVFKDSLMSLKGKTSQCVSRLPNNANCK